MPDDLTDDLDLTHLRLERPRDGVAVLTLDPKLQSAMEDLFARYDVPHGALVAIEPSSGRVLAFVSYNAGTPHRDGITRGPDVALDASPPTASVFKLITASALVSEGVEPTRRVCYGGGERELTAADLRDSRRRDRACATLRDAIGFSINAIMAKLADRHLTRATLRRFAWAFGFGQAPPFDVPTHVSKSDIPQSRLERARAAAGFWHDYMSPLHGALIAATFANHGRMPRAQIVERIEDRDGRTLYQRRGRMHRAVISASIARTVGQMMTRTCSRGTARGAFYDSAGRPFLPGIEAAGKTGTLTGTDPYRGYNWWVGFAPADDPKIAVAALVVNHPKWRIKASYVAREALRTYLLGTHD